MGREFWDLGVAALARARLSRRGDPRSSPDAGSSSRAADSAPDIVSPTLSRVFSAAQPDTFTHALLREQVYESTRRSYAAQACTSGWASSSSNRAPPRSWWPSTSSAPPGLRSNCVHRRARGWRGERQSTSSAPVSAR